MVVIMMIMMMMMTMMIIIMMMTTTTTTTIKSLVVLTGLVVRAKIETVTGDHDERTVSSFGDENGKTRF